MHKYHKGYQLIEDHEEALKLLGKVNSSLSQLPFHITGASLAKESPDDGETSFYVVTVLVTQYDVDLETLLYKLFPKAPIKQVVIRGVYPLGASN